MEELPIRQELLIIAMRRRFPDACAPQDIIGYAGTITHLRTLLEKTFQRVCAERKVPYRLPVVDTVKRALKRFTP
jgi:hypothetical protein